MSARASAHRARVGAPRRSASVAAPRRAARARGVVASAAIVRGGDWDVHKCVVSTARGVAFVAASRATRAFSVSRRVVSREGARARGGAAVARAIASRRVKT